MHLPTFLPLFALCAAPLAAQAQEAPAAPQRGFQDAAAEVRQRLDASLQELSALRERITAEKLPLAKRLNDLEAELLQQQLEYREVARQRDRGLLDLNERRNAIRKREQVSDYLATLFGQYVREFESRLHIAEDARYVDPVEAARLAPEDGDLPRLEVFRTQAALLDVSLDRLLEASGGARFAGSALDADGLVHDGDFVLVGPTALFRSADGALVGTVEQKVNSAEPSALTFLDPADRGTADGFVRAGGGEYVFDPSMGSAHRIEATTETFVEHVRKGGPVMIPIFAMAGLALLVALYKWLGLSFTPKPSRRRVRALLDAVERGDQEASRKALRGIRGPAGRMLAVGVEHMRQPRDLVEEVMYEVVLTARLQLQRFLPFIAICAASAPLLGLLGTVTGIINTFKMITVFGSGDVKSLSGGISEALITTKFGLIVAVPSLLLHAFLSRKARGVVADMERNALGFTNAVAKSRGEEGLHDQTAPHREMVRDHVADILKELLGGPEADAAAGGADAGGGKAPAKGVDSGRSTRRSAGEAVGQPG